MLHIGIRVLADEIVRQGHHRNFRCSDAYVAENARSNPFIHHDPRVLRVVREFNDKSLPIRGLLEHQP